MPSAHRAMMMMIMMMMMMMMLMMVVVMMVMMMMVMVMMTMMMMVFATCRNSRHPIDPQLVNSQQTSSSQFTSEDHEIMTS